MPFSLNALWHRAAALCVALLFALPAQATEHIVSRDYVEDLSGQWTLEQAQAQELQPFTNLLTKGYGKGALWVRLRIDPTVGGTLPSDNLYLRIRPMFLDDMRLFDEAEGFAPRAPIGDRHPFAAQDEPATVYVQRIKAGSEPRDLWIRLESTSTRFAFFEVLDGPTLNQSNLKLQTLGAAFLTLMSVFLVLGLSQSILRRDALSWAFTFYQAVALVHGAITLGYGRWWAEGWLPQPMVDQTFSVLVVCYIFSVLLYSNFLLRELAPSRLRAVVFYALSAVLFGLIGLQFVGMVGLSLTINRFVVLVMPLLFLVDALRQPRVHPAAPKGIGLTKRAVVVYFALTLVFAYLSALPTLGWTPALEVTIYAGMFYSLSAGVLMFGMLQYRANFLLRQREQLVNDARIANQRAELEHAQRLERERLIAMLGHELKTPLATLRMMLGDNTLPQQTAQQMSEPLKDINELIERTVQTGQLENDAIGLRPVACTLADTVQHAASNLPHAERLVWNIHPPADQQTVEADPFLLGVVVRNLLDNALKYSPDDATIDVDLHADTTLGKWVLEVHNPVGRAGLPDPAHVFDKFYRSPKASYRSGSGQGLFIAWRLAQLMGGELRYLPSDSTVCFSLTLPFSAPAKPTPAT